MSDLLNPILEEQEQKPLTEEELFLQEFPQELQDNLKSIVDVFHKEQQPIREGYLREWKQYQFYWNNIFDIYYDDLLHDWRPLSEGIQANPRLDIDSEDVGKSIGAFRATGESVISALSTGIPGVRFYPDNAENPEDLNTAKSYSKISDLIDQHNNASLLIVRALYTLWVQPCVFAYNYHNQDPSYGMVEVPQEYETVAEVEESYCPNCLSDLSGIEEGLLETTCPDCNLGVIPQKEVQKVPVVFSVDEPAPKGREIIEIYGPMNVKIPNYATDLKNCPYLILESEHHYTYAQELYPKIAEKIRASRESGRYERWARRPSDYFTDAEADLVTIRRCWLRPWAYNILGITTNKEDIENLRRKYPNGCYVVFVEDVFAEAIDEDLDEHWTVSISPQASHIMDIPMGRSYRDIQDMMNDIINLIIRTIKHGIPTTFADSDAIDWDKFQESTIEPGQIIPCRPSRNGTSMANRFHTVKTATLSQEVQPFFQMLQQLGQFVSKAFPSIYGGPQTSGSKTYKEYEMSRNQALQALGLTWKNLNVFWKEVKKKACAEYAKNVQADEFYSKKEGNSFINVWIKKAELAGSIGEVEAETSDQFPINSTQKRGLLIELLQMQSPEINSAIFNIENVGLISRLLGFGEIYVPGNDQRDKQIKETFEMMAVGPTEMTTPDGMPMMDEGMQPMMQSSIPPEPFDDHNVHMQCVQAFLVSEVGMALKYENPAAYQNISLHYQEHANAQAEIDAQNFQAQLDQQKAINQVEKPPKTDPDTGSEKSR